jgi:hypothetical protein
VSSAASSARRRCLPRGGWPVLAHRLVWGQFFQPVLIILVQAAFVVVDEYAGGDVLGICRAQAFLHAAFVQKLIGLRHGGDGCMTPSQIELRQLFSFLHRKIRHP